MASSRTQTKPNISVLGLGKLGACYAAFYARQGYTVLGLDINEKTVASINEGKPPVIEPKLAEYMQKSEDRFSATTDPNRSINESDVTFIIVPTPSEKSGLFSVDAILAAAKAVGPALRKKKKYHLFVVISTVLPGDSRERIIPAFERASGKKCGRDFGYVYSPTLIAIGNILGNLEEPDVVFLGAFDARSEKALLPIYEDVYRGHPVERMSIESVELGKIAVNSFVTMKISFANTLGALCAGIPGADVDAIVNAIGKDARIGRKFLTAGLGFGGPCFPRDNRAFASMAKRRGVVARLAQATDELNSDMFRRSVTLLKSQLGSGKKKTVGFLSVSYKPGTTFSEASQALAIAKAISRIAHVVVYEPLGNHDAVRALGKSATYVSSLSEIVEKSDILFLSNPDRAFASLPKVMAKHKKQILIDPWGMFRAASFRSNIIYHAPERVL